VPGNGLPTRPARRIADLPGVRRFWMDDLDQGNLHRFYDLRRAVENAVTTANDLVTDPEARGKHVKENIGLMRMKTAVNVLSRRNKMIRDKMEGIFLSDLPRDEKTRRLDELLRAQQKLMAIVPELRQKADMPHRSHPFPFSILDRG